ncbi:MAG: ribosome biogenesis GTPase Der [Verrucomicrobiota bacterium]
MSKTAHPVVAIVGRPNVGKSALFNRFAGRDLSIVHDRPGVTRDRLIVSARWGSFEFTLVDTGGIGLGDSEGFASAIEHEVELALETATQILFVVDIREGLTHLDKEIARKLRKSQKPIYLLLNKADTEKHMASSSEFEQLGFGKPYPVSAMHGVGIEDIKSELTEQWVESEPLPPSRPTRVAMIGRPNVGKSSLINAILNENRNIVSEVPGTTRDAVDVPFEWDGKKYVLIDTAGLRKKSRIDDALEAKMSGRTVHMINRADVCVLVLETLAGVREQDKKIASLIQKSKVPCVIALNKWDIAIDQGDANTDTRLEFTQAIQRALFFLPFAPVYFISAKSQFGLPKLLEGVHRMDQMRHIKFQTARLNKVIHDAQEKQIAPIIKGKRFKCYYAAQQFSEDPRSIPTLLLFVNDPEMLIDSYQRFLEIQIRKHFPLEGCPIDFIYRKRPQTHVVRKRKAFTYEMAKKDRAKQKNTRR